MNPRRPKLFSARIGIIGVNPFVKVPQEVVKWLLTQSEKPNGPIPVKGKLNGKRFIQTVVKYAGLWRLYLNTEMRNSTGLDVGDIARVELLHDSKPRTVPVPRKFSVALANNKAAQRAFEQLRPSRQKEILKYLGFLKGDEALERNIAKTIARLTNSKVDHLLWRSRK